MLIGDLARRAGVRPSAIRYYEGVGLLAPPARQSGRRVYDTAAVTQLQVISAARALGFGIREIRTLIQGGRSVTDRWRALARRKLPELESLIGRATRMKRLLEAGLNCSCVRMEDCLLHECSPPISVIRLHPGSSRSALALQVAPVEGPKLQRAADKDGTTKDDVRRTRTPASRDTPDPR
jgi:MerR family redox-sensitive transcriptional activator SoxR